LRSVQPLVITKGLDLQVCIEAGLPQVDVDTARIGQLVRNLLNNAVTHTPTNGTLAVTASSTNHEVVVSVRNTGTAIAPEHLPHIFDRFYRADASRRTTGGAGLGLAIVKQLVEAHGGRIEAQSTPGHGTTLSFALPAMR
jgi:two-component system sensor histidine kinase BaeS